MPIVKRAVVVGINDYPGVNADLRGCVNDALDWAAALQDRGYQITMLLDSAATKSAITAALDAAVAASGRYDRLAFTYSGHGTWLPDRDGDEQDRRDEALVCYDYQQGGLITDDQLHSILTNAPARTYILSDSCHSGSVSRFAGQALANAAPRFLPPQTFLTGEQLDAAARVEGVVASSPSRKGAVLISGCADMEVAYDVHSARPHGAFSNAALRTLETSGSINTWYKAIRQTLPNADHPQTPQLTATNTQLRWKPLL